MPVRPPIASPRTLARGPWCSSWTAPWPLPVSGLSAMPRESGVCCAPIRLTTPTTASSALKDSWCSPAIGWRRWVLLNIDLHTHSTCSDGALSPADLVGRAAAAGVEVLALTDHDTVAGLDEALRGAQASGIRFVPGVEISAAWRSQAIHVLGLWIDPSSPELRSMLQTQ